MKAIKYLTNGYSGVDLSPRNFPWSDRIHSSVVYDKLFFVIPTNLLNNCHRRFSEYRKDGSIADEAKLTMISFVFIVEALKNILQYRGENAGSFVIPDTGTPRILFLMTYVPKKAFDYNNYDNELQNLPPLFPDNDYLADDNIVAYMFSIFVFDPKIRISDAFADQIDLNCYGAPKLRPKRSLFGNDREQDERDTEDETSEIAQHVEQANFRFKSQSLFAPGAIPGFTTFALDEANSPFMFEKQIGNRPKNITKREDIKSPKDFAKFIQTLKNFENIVCLVSGYGRKQPDLSRVKQDFITIRRANQYHDSHPYCHLNAFSLENALSKLRELGADELFTNEKAWIMNLATDTYYITPPVVRCTVNWPLEYLNAEVFMINDLPHCRLRDSEMLLPGFSSKLNQSKEITEFDELLRSCYSEAKITSDFEKVLTEQSKYATEDMFDYFYSYFSALEAELNDMFVRQIFTQEQYYIALKKIRQQGFEIFCSKMDISVEHLPDGYKKMLIFKSTNSNLHTSDITHFWQTKEKAMTPFSQLKAFGIVAMAGIERCGEQNTLILPIIIRACDSVYFLKEGALLHKEHVRMSAGTGTGKSYLMKLAHDRMIPETGVYMSGFSGQALMGSKRSEKIAEFHEEVNPIMAPSSDPKSSGDLNLTLQKLAQLSSGNHVHQTTVQDPSTNERKSVRYSFQNTNVIIGANNPRNGNISPTGPGAAMNNRFTFISVGKEPNNKQIFSDVMNNTGKMYTNVQYEYRFVQRLIQMSIMNYCALSSTLGVPYPDIRLFRDIAPIALIYLVRMRPEIYDQLRNIGKLCTRAIGEVLRYSATMVCTTILNPEFTNNISLENYDVKKIMFEMSKYCVITMDIVIFVLSQMVFEVVDLRVFKLCQEILKFGNYYCFRQGLEAELDETFTKIKPSSKYYKDGNVNNNIFVNNCIQKWPKAARTVDIRPQNMDNYAASRPLNWPLEKFLEKISSYPVYLGIEAEKNRNYGKPSQNRYDMSPEFWRSNYIAANLQPIELDCPKNKDKDIFYASSFDCPELKVVRSATPVYKTEFVNNAFYVNPNYIEIQYSIEEFVRICNLGISKEEMMKILTDLQEKFIVAPFIPLLPAIPVIGHSEYMKIRQMHEIVQSLRYSEEAMTRFKKYRLPVVINETRTNKFHILVAYAEANPYIIVQNMVRHISYAKSRSFTCLLGVPHPKYPSFYDSLKVEPIYGKKLVLQRQQTQQTKIQKALHKAFNGKNLGFVGTMYPNTEVDVDLEDFYIRDYFARNFQPNEFLIEDYTPNGIMKRLYGENGLYNGHYVDYIFKENYPECFVASEMLEITDVFKEDSKTKNSMDNDNEESDFVFELSKKRNKQNQRPKKSAKRQNVKSSEGSTSLGSNLGTYGLKVFKNLPSFEQHSQVIDLNNNYYID